MAQEMGIAVLDFAGRFIISGIAVNNQNTGKSFIAKNLLGNFAGTSLAKTINTGIWRSEKPPINRDVPQP